MSMQVEDPRIIEFDVRTDEMLVNMGPQHPSTHGVLRIALELDGETIVSAHPDTGYLHSGFEKQGENVRYKDFVPYTDRMDYTSAMCNNLGYALAVEKLLGVEIPLRAQAIRVVVAEMQRIAAHLVWLATHILDVSGTGMSLLMYAFREREMILDMFELISGARLTYSYVRIGGVWKDVPPAFITKVEEFCQLFPARIDQYESMLTDSVIFRKRVEGIGKLSQATRSALAAPARCCAVAGLRRTCASCRPTAAMTATISRYRRRPRATRWPAIWCGSAKCARAFASSRRPWRT